GEVDLRDPLARLAQALLLLNVATSKMSVEALVILLRQRVQQPVGSSPVVRQAKPPSPFQAGTIEPQPLPSGSVGNSRVRAVGCLLNHAQCTANRTAENRRESQFP